MASDAFNPIVEVNIDKDKIIIEIIIVKPIGGSYFLK